MKALIVTTILSLSFFAIPGLAQSIQTLDLVCVDTSSKTLKIYQVIIEPEQFATIPEAPVPGPIYSGEYFAIVKNASFPDNPGTILYTGHQEFQLTQTSEKTYLFQAQKLGIYVNCEINGLASGGGGFSGSN